MCDLISRACVCILDVKEPQKKGTDKGGQRFSFPNRDLEEGNWIFTANSPWDNLRY